MQQDIPPDDSGNPFTRGFKHAAREAAKKAAAEAITARDQSILDRKQARKPKPPEKPFIPSPNPFGRSNG